MDLKNRVDRVKSWGLKRFEAISSKAKNITLPLFDGLPLYDVGLFFYRGLSNGTMKTRAAAIAYNILLVIFPTVIVIFALIPYIPVDGFQERLMDLVADMMPSNAYDALRTTIDDIIMQPSRGFLSLGFLTVVIFASNGIDALIFAFNASVNVTDNRSWLSRRLSGLLMGIIIVLIFTTGGVAIAASEATLSYLISVGVPENSFTLDSIIVAKWLIILLLLFFVTAVIFYLAPSSTSRIRFISAGGSVATILIIMISIGFSFYINNFGKYNTLYGSIGTLIVTMLWLYFNAFALLIGFELNASISSLIKDSRERKDGE